MPATGRTTTRTGFPVLFNGRFLAARQTGVQRAAGQMLQAIDALLQDTPPARPWGVVAPAGASTPRFSQLGSEGFGRLKGQLWEQLELPLRARGALLVNLCNAAPLVYAPMVTMIHDAQVFTTPESYSRAFAAWYRFSLPRIARRSELVLTVSEFSRRQLAEFGVAPMEKIRVVPNGVDHLLGVPASQEILARHGLRPQSYVVSLANTQKHKNLAVLLHAMAKAGPEAPLLVLVGAADAEAVAALGAPISDKVVFAGRVSDAALRGLLESALCYACPSTTEGFGLPPLEAMSLGAPAVVAPCGALPEVCADAALYAPFDDPDAWLAAFESLQEPTRRAAMSAQGLARAGEFTWRRSGEALLRSLVDAGAGF
jgi:glycosyltransferase involved in cell wall biosynthesis